MRKLFSLFSFFFIMENYIGSNNYCLEKERNKIGNNNNNNSKNQYFFMYTLIYKYIFKYL